MLTKKMPPWLMPKDDKKKPAGKGVKPPAAAKKPFKKKGY